MGQQGEACVDDTECIGSLFCADGVCCNTPCDGPTDSCVLPGRVGICSEPIEAPAMNWQSHIATGLALLTLAWFGLQAMRRRQEQ
jgi:hypothetical protein